MKLIPLLLAGFACCVAGCGDSQQSAAPQSGGQSKPAPADTMAQAGNEALVLHMHQHAEQFGRLNEALAAENLYAAQSAAYWLSRHEQAEGIAEDWQPHLAKMRQAALELEAAADLMTARAAAVRVAEGCNGCHSAAGVDKVIALNRGSPARL